MDSPWRPFSPSLWPTSRGSTKTTTAAYISHALAEASLSVLAVDADGENESLLSWSEAESGTFQLLVCRCLICTASFLGSWGPLRRSGDRHSPMKERRGVVASAIRLATHVLVPMAPTGMEYARVPAIRELVGDAAALAPNPAELAVVLTRTVPNAASTGVYRQMLTDDGVRVLGPTVGRLSATPRRSGYRSVRRLRPPTVISLPNSWVSQPRKY